MASRITPGLTPSFRAIEASVPIVFRNSKRHVLVVPRVNTPDDLGVSQQGRPANGSVPDGRSRVIATSTNGGLNGVVIHVQLDGQRLQDGMFGATGAPLLHSFIPLENDQYLRIRERAWLS